MWRGGVAAGDGDGDGRERGGASWGTTYEGWHKAVLRWWARASKHRSTATGGRLDRFMPIRAMSATDVRSAR